MSPYLSSHCFYFENGARRRGGAVALKNQSQSYNNRSILSNCVLDENTAFGRGGAIHVAPGAQISPTISTPGGNLHVSNCTVHGNSSINAASGGLWANESAPIPPTIVVDNSIFWKNSDATATTADNQIGGVLSVDFCDVQGSYAGLSNISQNPRFVDAAGDNFRLKSISACRNAADNGRLQMDFLDVDEDGNFFELNPVDIYFATRVKQGVVDIGAAETFLGDAGTGTGVE